MDDSGDESEGDENDAEDIIQTMPKPDLELADVEAAMHGDDDDVFF